jgi:Tfp pilus assembly protein PilV
LKSIRFSSRGRTKSQRGFVLIAALVLSVLYFGLMSLILIDSTRALHEANRFRARIVAATLAENGAELAAHDITSLTSRKVEDKDWQGTMSGEMTRTNEQFEINAQGTAIGVLTQKALVRVQGRVQGNVVIIDYTMHTQ